MKKILLIITILISLIMAHTVFAGKAEEELEPVPFAFVVNETDDFQPESEYSVTFTRTITINAETIEGARISVTVLSGEKSDLPPVIYEEAEVGPTLKFIQRVSLRVGDNIVKITVEKEGYAPVTIETLVKRKDGVILESLQNLFIVPSIIK